MKKLTLLATAFLAFLIALPLMAAAFVVSSAPAVAQAVQCTSAALPATGQWRPPFQQAYTVSARGFGSQFHPIYQEWRAHTGQDMSSLPGPGMFDSGTRSRGLSRWRRCQSSEYRPPTRARSGPVRFEPNWNGWS